MVIQMSVDVEKSLGYQANGRLKSADKKETSHLNVKRFICPNCHAEEEGVKIEFGEAKTCEKCDTVMIHQM